MKNEKLLHGNVKLQQSQSFQTEKYHFISHAHAKQNINPTFYKKVLTNALAVWLGPALE